MEAGSRGVEAGLHPYYRPPLWRPGSCKWEELLSPPPWGVGSPPPGRFEIFPPQGEGDAGVWGSSRQQEGKRNETRARGEGRVRGNVAACPDSMVVQGHLTHCHWEEPRLAPGLAHHLLALVNDTLEDSIEWSHLVNFVVARCDGEE